jgi:hypothetical protein
MQRSRENNILEVDCNTCGRQQGMLDIASNYDKYLFGFEDKLDIDMLDDL